MKFLAFYTVICIVILPIPIMAFDLLAPSQLATEANVTHWREHRRKKRFILFETAGICKLVTGVTFPVDLGDKKPWRQLVLTMNLQYQFPLPTAPIHWWNKFHTRNFPNGVATIDDTTVPYIQKRDEAQEFLYEFAETLMKRKGLNGRDCLQKAICENAQIHEHLGVYAEILHRVLKPHRTMESHYTEPWHLGKKGINCKRTYHRAQNCIIDDYLHVREDYMEQHTVM